MAGELVPLVLTSRGPTDAQGRMDKPPNRTTCVKEEVRIGM